MKVDDGIESGVGLRVACLCVVTSGMVFVVSSDAGSVEA